MRTIKKILIAIVILVAIPLILALFTKKEYIVEEVITINKPKQEVFDYIKLLKNQNEYSKWATMDPNMEKSFRGTDGTVGFVSAWKSGDEHVGSGEQEIIDIKEGERIDFELRFFEPFESSDLAYMTTESIASDKTMVKWGFKGHMNYPMNIMLLFMDMEEMIGNDFSYGLEKLKAVVE